MSPALPKASDFCPSCLRVMTKRGMQRERGRDEGEEDGNINKGGAEKWKGRG